MLYHTYKPVESNIWRRNRRSIEALPVETYLFFVKLAPRQQAGTHSNQKSIKSAHAFSAMTYYSGRFYFIWLMIRSASGDSFEELVDFNVTKKLMEETDRRPDLEARVTEVSQLNTRAQTIYIYIYIFI
jgi:hypothetical protein